VAENHWPKLELVEWGVGEVPCLSIANVSRRKVDAMADHAVVVVGAGPTGLMLAGELALAGVDVAIAERRVNQDLIGARAGGLHARTIEVFDQRGIAERFLAHGRVAQVAGFSQIPLDISDFPTRHPYGLALWQNHIEHILASWVFATTLSVSMPLQKRPGRQCESW
jgi:2-polyprenyl-6-methoxyphenol hydroxylase-like FAD-dependent oxidoreductase